MKNFYLSLLNIMNMCVFIDKLWKNFRNR